MLFKLLEVLSAGDLSSWYYVVQSICKRPPLLFQEIHAACFLVGDQLLAHKALLSADAPLSH